MTLHTGRSVGAVSGMVPGMVLEQLRLRLRYVGVLTVRFRWMRSSETMSVSVMGRHLYVHPIGAITKAQDINHKSYPQKKHPIAAGANAAAASSLPQGFHPQNFLRQDSRRHRCCPYLEDRQVAVAR